MLGHNKTTNRSKANSDLACVCLCVSRSKFILARVDISTQVDLSHLWQLMVSSGHPLQFPPWILLLVIPLSSLLCDDCTPPVNSQLLPLHHWPSSLSCCPLLHFSFGDLNKLFSAAKEIIQCFHNRVYTRLQVKRSLFHPHTHTHTYLNQYTSCQALLLQVCPISCRVVPVCDGHLPSLFAAPTALPRAGFRV